MFRVLLGHPENQWIEARLLHSPPMGVVEYPIIANHDLAFIGDMGCHSGEIKVLGELPKQIGAQKETGKGERWENKSIALLFPGIEQVEMGQAPSFPDEDGPVGSRHHRLDLVGQPGVVGRPVDVEHAAALERARLGSVDEDAGGAARLAADAPQVAVLAESQPTDPLLPDGLPQVLDLHRLRIEAEDETIGCPAVDRPVPAQDHGVDDGLVFPSHLAGDAAVRMPGEISGSGPIVKKRAVVSRPPDPALCVKDERPRDAAERFLVEREAADRAFVHRLSGLEVHDEEMPAGEGHTIENPVSIDQRNDAFAGDRDAEVQGEGERPGRIGRLHPIAALDLFPRLEPVDMSALITLVAQQDVLSPFVDPALVEERRPDVDRSVGRRGQGVENALPAGQVAQREDVAPFRIEDKEVGPLSGGPSVETAVGAEDQGGDRAFAGRDHVQGRPAEDTQVQPQRICRVHRRFLGR